MSKGTRSMSDSITQTVMADRANAVETVRPAAPAAKQRLTSAPPGFTDSVKEIAYEPREADAFGAIDVGDVVVAGGPTDNGSKPGDVVIEEDPNAKPEDITGAILGRSTSRTTPRTTRKRPPPAAKRRPTRQRPPPTSRRPPLRPRSPALPSAGKCSMP